jgi:hypothetical protein
MYSRIDCSSNSCSRNGRVNVAKPAVINETVRVERDFSREHPEERVRVVPSGGAEYQGVDIHCSILFKDRMRFWSVYFETGS